MDVVRGHQHAPPWRGAAIAIGNFDGVHVGHRALIERARELAASHDALAVVLTFDPHPAAIVGARAPTRVASLSRRLELLEAAGADAVVVEPFTRELAACAPTAFVDDLLINTLRARALVVGYDFAYGTNRSGTTDTLRAHGNQRGVEVDVVAPVTIDGEIASSSRVRAHLAAGELDDAARLLGRRWDVDGVVVHGAERGRAIGVPTANIRTDIELSLRPGIYAVTLAVEDDNRFNTPLPAVASLGTNPTFVDSNELVLEVHVLDWSGDLYDRRVRTTFAARLRDEAKFASVDALVAQIRADIAAARALLA
jgi:riboflavin kinase/FMN adenylyltransferase